jgi:hypothetical protein
MTERPESTPGASPDEPEAAPEAETVTGAPEATEAATEERMAESAAYDPERDAAEVDEIESELEAEAGEAGEFDDELEEETVQPLGAESSAPVAGANGAAAGPRRRQAPPASVQRAPTQSELAVRVTDNASRFFVIGTVVVFVAILFWGLVGGVGGFLTATPAITAAPSVSVEAPASPS